MVLGNVRMHCNTFHNIFTNLFESTPFDALGYVYYDEDSNYFAIQSDISLFDKLVRPELREQIICKYFSSKKCNIIAENIEAIGIADGLIQTLKSLEYKSVIRIVTYCRGRFEIVSFFSKQNFETSVSYCINKTDDIKHAALQIKKRMSILVTSNHFDKLLGDKSLVNQSETQCEFKEENKDAGLFLSTKEIPLKLHEFSLDNIEKEIVILLYYGFTLDELSEKLEISRRTVDRRLNSIRLKLNCKSNLNIIPILLNRSMLN